MKSKKEEVEVAVSKYIVHSSISLYVYMSLDIGYMICCK